MTAADEERNDQRGKVDDEFGNGDTASRVELHLEEWNMVYVGWLAAGIKMENEILLNRCV